MLSLLLCLQASVLSDPLILTDEPPPVRALQGIELRIAGSPGAPAGLERTREEALGLAAELGRRLAAGADFDALVERHSEARNRALGSHLGAFVPGALPPALDEFLWSAAPGEVSEPIALTDSVWIVRRVDALAGCLHLLVAGTDDAARERADLVARRLAAGEGFAELARELSDERESAARGGQYQVFERGPTDRLLKKAVFDAAVGDVLGPIEAIDGFHFAQRVPPAAIDPALRERTRIRVRALLLTHDESAELVRRYDRAAYEAAALARELHARIAAGEDMAALAREHTDDPGGRERGGDLGWIHRRTPGVLGAIDRLFPRPPGTLLEPQRTALGWLVLRREE